MAANRNSHGSGSTATAPRRRPARKAIAPKKPIQIEASASSAASRPITHEMIAARAYELWKMRGGDADQNWHEAEELLRTGL